MLGLIGGIGGFLGVFLFIMGFMAMKYRRVVPTNEVHTVQSGKKTIPYGRGLSDGNVYYEWPSRLPVVGITKIDMPTSIFDINLEDYSAYDKDRVPFQVDVIGFFQIDEPATAAQRVSNFSQLKEQLDNILKGAIRSILANSNLESILGERSSFGDAFSTEVESQLSAWGVKSVKNIELMDIRDTVGSNVISNIMAKKKSEIEKDSRIEVATNMKLAELSEIDARKESEVRQQNAEREVGEKEAEKYKMVGVAKEQAKQDIKEQERLTTEKQMAVNKVEQEKQADIDKNVAIINAEQAKQTQKLEAEADLITKERDADGIKAVGSAEAEAEKLILMAPVEAQITLAKEIGSNEGYMDYLLGTEGIKAGQAVGEAKASAMAEADMKIITNAGDMEGGLTKMMDVFSAKGGAGLGSMLETLSNTPVGKSLLDKFTAQKEV